jgi:hypothetical protein
VPEHDTYLGTAKQRGEQEQKRGILRLINSIQDPRDRLMMQIENVGGKVPAGFYQRPAAAGTVHDTPNGLVRIGPDNTVTPLGVQGYHPPNTAIDTRLDKSFQNNKASLDKLATPIEDLGRRMSRLSDSINQQTPQADAVVAPELLSVMAGGTGSGLRMNEAEISRIVGGRSNFESLKAALNKWQLDPNKALSITPDQRQQMRALVGAVNERNKRSLAAINAARYALIDANDVDTHRRILADVEKQLQQINETPDTASSPGSSSALDILNARRKAGGR